MHLQLPQVGIDELAEGLIIADPRAGQGHLAHEPSLAAHSGRTDARRSLAPARSRSAVPFPPAAVS